MRIDLPDGRRFTFYYKHFTFFTPGHGRPYKLGDLWRRSSPPSKYPRSTLCAINQDNPTQLGDKRTWVQKTFSYSYWNPAVEPQYKGHETSRRRALAKALARGGFTREERRIFWASYWKSKNVKPKEKTKKVGFRLETANA